MPEGSTSAIQSIADTISGFTGDLSTVCVAAAVAGGAALLAWVGWRLGCKFLNRAAGK